MADYPVVGDVSETLRSVIDDFIGHVSAHLDRQEPGGVWAPTDLAAVLTRSSILTWPGLGREFEPVFSPARRYRARIDAALDRPASLHNTHGFIAQQAHRDVRQAVQVQDSSDQPRAQCRR